MNTKTMPCYRCGSRNVVVRHDKSAAYLWLAECGECRERTACFDEKNLAIESWNHRVKVQEAITRTIKDNADVWRKLAEL
jgi:transcription elongation factor Elf1